MPKLTPNTVYAHLSIISLYLFTSVACVSQAAVGQTSISAQERAQISDILDRLDQLDLPLQQRLADYSDDAVILVPGESEIRGHSAIRTHLASFTDAITISTDHHIVELSRAGNLFIVQGGVTGTATLPTGDITQFATKNMILLRASDNNRLKIWKVIYNAAPVPPSSTDVPQTRPEEAEMPDNPFAAFFGTWTLQADRFQQVWDGKTLETITIPNHLTHCGLVNTTQTVLCEVTADGLPLFSSGNRKRK